MDVTKNNFKEAYCMLEKSLPNADFVSIDAEFSGLSTIKGPRYSYNTLEENYLKTKKGSEHFLILQYGICLFTWNEENNRYTAFPFTFNVYPRPYKRYFNDVMFMVQSSCLDFLSQNNFDFNKLFYESISFVHPSTEKKVKDKYDNATKIINKKDSRASANEEKPAIQAVPKEESKVFIPKDKREFMGKIITMVEEFVVDCAKSSLDLPTCNPFERKLIYEILEERYPMGLYLQSEMNEKKEKYVRVVKITEKGKSMKFQEGLLQDSEFYNQTNAFNLVMKLLVQAQKPIIGHNMYLDMFYTCANFLASPPDCLSEYKLLLNGLFPVIYDTKVISSTNPLSGMLTKGTGLKNLTESIGVDLVPCELDFDEYVGDKINTEASYHDAGFDALSTGKCFISLIKSLMLHFDKGDGRIQMDGNLLKPFQNRIFVMGINDINYVTVHKEDQMPSRRGIYLVTFPPEWKETDLHNLFSPICKIFANIVWVNDTSAYVSLQDKTKHEQVIEQYVKNKKHSNIFQIIPFPEQNNGTEDDTNETAAPETSSTKRKLISYQESDPEDGEISSDEEEDSKSPKNSNLTKKSEQDVKEPKAKKQAMFNVSEDW